MKTHYEGHDRLYQRFRERGQPGWSVEYDNFKVHVEQVLSHGQAPLSGKLLELGCGAGNMALWFANRGYDVSGIDISPTAIEWAEENARDMRLEATFAVGTVTTLEPYADDQFDFVFDGYCLHCIIGDDRRRMLESVYRVLKPGGYCLINTMCEEVDISALSSTLSENQQHYDQDSRCIILDDSDIAIRYFGRPQEIVYELQSAGFKVLRWIVDTTQQVHNDDLVIEAIKE